MSFITDSFNDKAVYWGPNGYDKYGKPKLLPPIEICCRWEDAREEFIDESGQTMISFAHVYVDRHLYIGGRLWHCPRKYHCRNCCIPVAPLNPYDNTLFVYEIKKTERTPDLENDVEERLVIL